MRKWLVLSYALALLGFLAIPARPMFFNPPMFMPKTAAVAYSGPGNVVSGALTWYGMRAYTSALANAGASTTKVLDVLGSTTVTACTIFLKGDGTGGLDLTTSGAGGVGNQCSSGATTFCTITNTSCSVSKWYDQSGALNCGAAVPCSASQATAANQPILTFSCVGSSPCLKNTGGRSLATANFTAAGISQPISGSSVSNYAAGSGASVIIAQQIAGTVDIYFSTNILAGIYAGTVFTTTYVNATTVARNDVFNNTSSVMNINGTETTGTTGTGGISNNILFLLFTDNFGQNTSPLSIAEAGFWPSGFSAGNRTSLCQNQQAYYGSGNFGAAC